MLVELLLDQVQAAYERFELAIAEQVGADAADALLEVVIWQVIHEHVEDVLHQRREARCHDNVQELNNRQFEL